MSIVAKWLDEKSDSNTRKLQKALTRGRTDHFSNIFRPIPLTLTCDLVLRT